MAFIIVMGPFFPGDDVTTIFDAVRYRDVATVSAVLDHDPELLEVREETKGATPLLAAAARGRLDVVNELLRRGANVDATDHAGQTALHLATSRNSREVVFALLDRGARLDRRDTRGVTALMHGADNGDASLVQRMLQDCPPGLLDARDEDGTTAFVGACMVNQTDVARILLWAGADHTIPEVSGRTALQAAMEHGSDEIIALIQVRRRTFCKARIGSQAQHARLQNG